MEVRFDSKLKRKGYKLITINQFLNVCGTRPDIIKVTDSKYDTYKTRAYYAEELSKDFLKLTFDMFNTIEIDGEKTFDFLIITEAAHECNKPYQKAQDSQIRVCV